MKILVVGRHTPGSWVCRGEQLGRAIGARVRRNPGKKPDPQFPDVVQQDFAWADLIVLVKRSPEDLLHHVHRSGKPVVYDPVDPWPQPHGNAMDAAQARAWFQALLRQIKPLALVGVTKQQIADANFSGPTLHLPHHARAGIKPRAVREERRLVVGYDGSPQFLGPWFDIITEECKRRGWVFHVGYGIAEEFDIGIALRGGEHDGYPCRAWKSCVKLANYQTLGTPAILARETGYLEQASGAELWADSREELSVSLDSLMYAKERRERSSLMLTRAESVSLPALAAKYKTWLGSVLAQAKS